MCLTCKKVENMPDAISECEKIRRQLEVVPKWGGSAILAIKTLEGLCPRMESLSADMEMLKVAWHSAGAEEAIR